jgi:drug/metabolite transporter (DMT)-like permease
MEGAKKNHKAEMLLGISLYTLAATLFSFYCLLVKISLYKFNIGVAELVYMISCWAAPGFFLLAKLQKQDVLLIPGSSQSDLFWRCFYGVLCDVLMFVSYEYISYSKGFCLFMTNTLIAPFLASWMLKEPVKKWDMIGIMLGFLGMLCLVQPWKSNLNQA